MMLSDSLILEKIREGSIVIHPFFRECLGSNSYDVHLSPHLAIYTSDVIDSRTENPTREMEIPEKGLVLMPGELYLGSTMEYTESYGVVPFLEGKSSTGRLGISIHETAGKGDAGFKGNWTLEMTVSKAVRVYFGMPIGQLIYQSTGDLLVPYDKKDSAKYSNQGRRPVPSQMWKNFGKDPIWRP